LNIEITKELLNELDKNAEAATGGEWQLKISNVTNGQTGITRKSSWIVLHDGSNLPYQDDEGVRNNRHIATANPDVVRSLVAEIRRLHQKVDELKIAQINL
jgi:hypothetical protein